MSADRYLTTAQNIAQVIPGLLSEQGLNPLINRYVLTETEQSDVWLFVVLDGSALEALEAYSAKSVLSRLSTALGGYLVLFSISFGMRYAVRLSPAKKVPRPTLQYQ
jgi:hypothetical protein